MPAIKKAAISFGLVHIPVELHTAMLDSDVHFNQLVPVDGSDEMSRVKYKKVCAATGREVTSNEIKKGYQYEKDKYVVVEDHELEALKTERDKNITIVSFVDGHTIPPMLFNKAYHVVPQKDGEKPFELLRRVMVEENRAAVAKTVIGSTERLVVILPRENGVVLQTLYFEGDIKPIPKPVKVPEISEAELAMARQLVGAMVKPFDGKQYRDDYQEKVRALIDSKIASKEVTKDQAVYGSNTVIDLMEALKASLATNEKKTISKPKLKKPKVAKAS